VHVHEDQVGPELRSDGERLLTAGGRADDDEPVGLGDDSRHGEQERLLVVHDHDAHLGHGRHLLTDIVGDGAPPPTGC